MASLVNFDAWLVDTSFLRTWMGDQSRPASVGNIIQDKPSSIVIERDGVANLAAQTVRLDTYTAAQEVGYFFDTGLLRTQGFVLLGYKEHPTIADTNIQSGDRFVLDSRIYEVEKVEASFTDRVLAFVKETE